MHNFSGHIPTQIQMRIKMGYGHPDYWKSYFYIVCSWFFILEIYSSCGQLYSSPIMTFILIEPLKLKSGKEIKNLITQILAP